MSPNNVLPLEEKDESYSLMGIDPDVQPLFDLNGFVCGCPAFWSSPAATESAQSVHDPAQQLFHLLDAHYSHTVDLSDSPATQWTPVPVPAGLPRAYNVQVLRHPTVQLTVQLEPVAAPSRVFKETCIFWYHGTCKRGDACDREHALNHNWPIHPPPGYSHKSRQCKLLFCPFRSDLVEFMQKHYPNQRAELEEEGATDTEDDNEVTDDESISDLLTSPSESHDGETPEQEEAPMDHNASYVPIHNTRETLSSPKPEPKPMTRYQVLHRLNEVALNRGVRQISPSIEEGEVFSDSEADLPHTTRQARHNPAYVEMARELGYNDIEDVDKIFERGTDEERNEMWAQYLNVRGSRPEPAQDSTPEAEPNEMARFGNNPPKYVWIFGNQVRVRRGPPPAAPADLLYRDQAIPFNRKKEKSKKKQEKQESGNKGPKRKRDAQEQDSNGAKRQRHQSQDRDTEGSASMDESE